MKKMERRDFILRPSSIVHHHFNVMDQIVIIADDLTGAADTGVQFCPFYDDTILIPYLQLYRAVAPSSGQAVALYTNSRALEMMSARKRLRSVARRLSELKPLWIYKKIRVTHVSTHVSLREACERVKKDRVLRVIDLTWDALQNFGVTRPRIGVAGLNPHCGEGGMFGREDDEEVMPAVESARRKGYGVEGPIPADTVFSKMKGGMYDAVVVMYHDQGHIPMKFLGFQYDEKTGQWGEMSGVNVTLGLPIVRTSVDHGTAFGKAGEGRANPQSMIEAIQLGAMLAKKS